MVVLDNLVVSTALPVIRVDLGASLEELEWTVNAYTLTFAVFLLTGAALGDRFGRKRMFMHRRRDLHGRVRRRGAGAVGRLADRRARGAGLRRRDRHAADADDPERRRPARAARGSRSARGPASPGSRSRWARSSAVPSSTASRGSGSSGSTCPSGSSCCRSRRSCARARARTGRSTSPASRSRAAGCSGSSGASSTATATAGRARGSSARSSAAPSLLAAFVAWELRTPRADAADAVLPQPRVRGGERRVAPHVLRDVRLDLPADPVLPDGAGLLAARVRAARPPLDAHADVRRADRRRALRPDRRAAVDGDRARAAGDRPRAGSPPSRRRPSATRRSSARSSSPASAWGSSSRRSRTSSSRPSGREEEGKASGANNAIREVGGVLGVAVLASIFARYGGYESPETFNDGLVPALWIGAVVVGSGSAARAAHPAQAAAGRGRGRPRGGAPRSAPEAA